MIQFKKFNNLKVLAGGVTIKKKYDLILVNSILAFCADKFCMSLIKPFSLKLFKVFITVILIFLIQTGNVFSNTNIFDVDNIELNNLNDQNREKLLNLHS